VTFEKWDEILDGSTLPVYDKPREQAWRHWAIGVAHAEKGEVSAAKLESRAMQAALKEFSARVHNDVPSALRVAQTELEAHIAWAVHNRTKALALLQQAGRKERALRYTEPPWYPRPVLEVLGRKAIADGKPQMAESAFREALDQFPESRRAVSGLAEALEREGKSAGAGF
jgi:Flp pilus assembly protein TadD